MRFVVEVIDVPSPSLPFYTHTATTVGGGSIGTMSSGSHMSKRVMFCDADAFPLLVEDTKGVSLLLDENPG